MPTALTLAERIAANPPLAVQALKAGLRRTLDPDWQGTGRRVIAQIGMLSNTEDSQEGVRAFLEERVPVYVSRRSSVSGSLSCDGPLSPSGGVSLLAISK